MTVCVSIVRAMIDEAERRGFDAGAMLASAHLEPTLVDDPRARIDVHALDAMIRWVLDTTGDPAFGLTMGEHATLASFGLVGHMVAQCRTIRESFESLIGYYRMVADVSPPKLVTLGERVHLVCDPIQTEDALCNRVRSEFLMARLAAMGKTFLGDASAEIELFFPYAAPAHADVYARVFGGRERFAKDELAIVFPKRLLEVKQRHHDGELLSVLRTQADRWLAELERSRGIVVRVKELVLASDAKTHPEMSELARKLGMSERSLRRRLAAAGVSFHDVLHDARASLATRMLSRSDATVDAVAHALGFSSTAAFQRAFKRWSGKRLRDVVGKGSDERSPSDAE